MHEKNRNEIVHPNNLFVSQFDNSYEVPRAVKRTSCGIASLTMALRYLSQRDINPTNVVREFLSYGRYSRPTFDAVFEASNLVFPILVVGSDRSQNESIAYNIVNRLSTGREAWQLRYNESQSTSYMPTFTLGRGTDMRGMVSYLNYKGYSSQLLEFDPYGNGIPISPNHLLTTSREVFLDTFAGLNEGKPISIGNQIITKDMEPIILASIDMRDLDYPPEIKYVADPKMALTHVITVLPNRGNGVLYLDPAMADVISGVQVRSQDFISKVLLPNSEHRGHFTVAWRNGG